MGIPSTTSCTGWYVTILLILKGSVKAFTLKNLMTSCSASHCLSRFFINDFDYLTTIDEDFSEDAQWISQRVYREKFLVIPKIFLFYIQSHCHEHVYDVRRLAWVNCVWPKWTKSIALDWVNIYAAEISINKNGRICDPRRSESSSTNYMLLSVSSIKLLVSRKSPTNTKY